MANPTTNYGFVLPTPTDLVTDLPADFDVALQGVDTRLKALQPGTTQGDLAYSSSTANTNVRLGIGTAGQNLTVVSGVPAWASPVSATAVGCILFNAANQSIANNVETKVGLDSEVLDTDGFHSTVTNTSRITIPAGKAGIYYIAAWAAYANNATGYRQLEVIINGRTGTPNRCANVTGQGNNLGLVATGAVKLIVGDFIELQTYQNSGGSLNLFGGGGDIQFSAILLGA